jgi:hypothetical protein
MVARRGTKITNAKNSKLLRITRFATINAERQLLGLIAECAVLGFSDVSQRLSALFPRRI